MDSSKTLAFSPNANHSSFLTAGLSFLNRIQRLVWSFLVGLKRFVTRESFQKRLRPYGITIFVLWPLVTIWITAAELRHLPYYSLPWSLSLLGATAGTLLFLPDFIFIGLLIWIFGISLFSALSEKGMLRCPRPLLYEPWSLFLAVLLVTSLFYPGVMGFQSFVFLHQFPFWGVILILTITLLLLSVRLAAPHTWLKVFLIILACGCLPTIGVTLRNRMPVISEPEKPPLVLLGLDSLSHSDDLTLLQSWSATHGGIWYTKPVAPGLLTNSVWTSLLTQSYVHDHGIFHTFQSLPDADKKVTLVSQAKAQDYWTVSVFPDQMTCFVGSKFGFDDDRSGALGWRQIVTSLASNSSVLLPLFRPVLPRLPFSPAPPNQAGAFTYDLEREISNIFSARHSSKKVFVTAHTTYLHSPLYPRTMEMSWEEMKNVFTARAKSLRDRSFDWQDVDLPTDPVKLRQWKLQHLQKILIQVVEQTRFLQREGQLLLISDHGDRAGLTLENFTEERYHRVILITFNLPKKDPSAPISLLDTGNFLGFNKPSFLPIVEYTNSTPDDWGRLGGSTQISFDGHVLFDEGILNRIFQTLKTHTPWDKQQP